MAQEEERHKEQCRGLIADYEQQIKDLRNLNQTMREEMGKQQELLEAAVGDSNVLQRLSEDLHARIEAVNDLALEKTEITLSFGIPEHYPMLVNTLADPRRADEIIRFLRPGMTVAFLPPKHDGEDCCLAVRNEGDSLTDAWFMIEATLDAATEEDDYPQISLALRSNREIQS